MNDDENPFICPEWLRVVEGFGMRALEPDEQFRLGDFHLSEGYAHGGYIALYVSGYSVEKRRTPRIYNDGRAPALVFRYTRALFTDDPTIRADAAEDEVMAAVRQQMAEAAAAERKVLGDAVMVYRLSKDAGADEESLRKLAACCDTAMAGFVFETRGVWWDAKHGTWGIGHIEEDELEPSGAIVSGPHC